VGAEDGLQILPAEQLHHQERRPGLLVDAGVEGLDDVLALDRRRDPRLQLEALAGARRGDHRREHDLEGASLLRREVLALVHRAHAPRGEAAEDAVTALEDRPLREIGRVRMGHGSCPG